jgi:hypothetical protein
LVKAPEYRNGEDDILQIGAELPSLEEIAKEKYSAHTEDESPKETSEPPEGDERSNESKPEEASQDCP